MSSTDKLNEHPSSEIGEEVAKQSFDLKAKNAPRRKEAVEPHRQVYHSPLDRSDWVFFGGLTLVTALAVATRLYKITEPRHVA